MVNVIDIFARWWIEELLPELPRTLTIDLLPCLTISWVFQMPNEFNRLTLIAERESDENLALWAEDFPIPKSVILKFAYIALDCPTMCDTFRS
jgi:hypothetical protein